MIVEESLDVSERCPGVDLGTLYSNFDHTYDDDVRRLVERREGFGRHSALNFNAKIWLAERGDWISVVMHYGQVVDVVSSADLLEVIDAANERWGGK